MHYILRTGVTLILSMMLISWSVTVRAEFTSITVIGDSLSDGGSHETAVISAYKLFGDPFTDIVYEPNSPTYFNYRYTDAYVAVEYLGYRLGLFNKAHFSNYAVGGATTKMLPLVIDLMNKTHAFDPTGLYIIEVGQNDLLDYLYTADPSSSPEAIASNIITTMQDLYARGVNHLMVINAVKLGLLPRFKNATPVQKNAYNNASIVFNRKLKEKISALSFKDDVTLYDLATTLEAGISLASTFGISNTVDDCAAMRCTDAREFLWIDNLHLSSVAHKALGHSMYLTIAPKAPAKP